MSCEFFDESKIQVIVEGYDLNPRSRIFPVGRSLEFTESLTIDNIRQAIFDEAKGSNSVDIALTDPFDDVLSQLILDKSLGSISVKEKDEFLQKVQSLRLRIAIKWWVREQIMEDDESWKVTGSLLGGDWIEDRLAWSNLAILTQRLSSGATRKAFFLSPQQEKRPVYLPMKVLFHCDILGPNFPGKTIVHEFNRESTSKDGLVSVWSGDLDQFVVVKNIEAFLRVRRQNVKKVTVFWNGRMLKRELNLGENGVLINEKVILEVRFD